MTITELEWHWIAVTWEAFGWEWEAGFMVQRTRFGLPFAFDVFNLSDGNRLRDYTVGIYFLCFYAHFGVSHYSTADMSTGAQT